MFSTPISLANEAELAPVNMSDSENFFLFLADSIDEAGELITPLDLDDDSLDETAQREYTGAEENTL